jgi:F0F1-type ATP synthase membrane subunit c/vacuolar-type H+-ATPase subunit K
MLAMPRFRRAQVSKAQTTAAPVRGWNARDPIAAMHPEDAIYLENWWPTPTSVDIRRGAEDWATGITGTVESLLSYSAPSGSQKLFAAAISGGVCSIYDATAQGAVGAAESTGALTNARWQYINFVNSGGSYLVCVNGADDLLLYNGTTWTQVDGASVPAITGVTTADLVGVTVFKNRIWFVEDGTLSAWYLGTQAVSGAATEFDVSSQCRRGGFLMAIGSWTIDAGDGVDDYLVFVTSEGEILVYRGTDPASAATWALQGRWEVGSPIGRRCLQKYAGDLLVISQDGVLPLSRALQSSRINPKVALTDRIQFAMSEAAGLYGTVFGWSLTLYPGQNMLLLNVPMDSTHSDQFVMNTITGAWARFTNWNANCLEWHAESIWFGTAGKVVKAWSGTDDMGADIQADGKSAFNYFGSRRQKQFTLARPIIASTTLPPLAVGLNLDFSDADPVGVVSGNLSAAALWDSGTWDAALWGGDKTIFRNWQGVRGVGFCAATRLKFAGSGFEVSWISTDYVYQDGGIL